ncbi:MAG TPA: DUF3343 domain-containing protein [Spirochaetota bacterium]|nr:DUF3343 domain-containing protein [Spirochaetota bacterium]HRS63681.1 DUF3343 domain-containing protein [Spirochaetota bacterium]HRU64333.1 DUF3343 domain-containing protein [Spirochaetota bacterium]
MNSATNMYSVVLFHSTNYAIWASNILKRNSVEHKMIPVPRHLSSDCGYCVRFLSKDRDIVYDLLINNGVLFDKIEEI